MERKRDSALIAESLQDALSAHGIKIIDLKGFYERV